MRWPLLLFLLWILGADLKGAEKVDLRAQSTSKSRQFIVYGLTPQARSAVTERAEQVKQAVLDALGESDQWKFPIAISLSQAREWGPVDLRLFTTPDGLVIQMRVQIGDDPVGLNFRKHIAKAVLLEVMYRGRPELGEGERYLDAPWWVAAGITQAIREREFGSEPDFFKGLLEVNRIPAVEDFLKLNPDTPGPAGQRFDEALSLALLQMLWQQPDGKSRLGQMIRHWPKNGGDPIVALLKDFPGLGASPGAVQKWWTLAIQGLASTERIQAMTGEATFAALESLLIFEFVGGKIGEKKSFPLRRFEEFVSHPACKTTLGNAQLALAALRGRASPLFVAIIVEYEKVLADLTKGKTKGMSARIAGLEGHLRALVQRGNDITDYMNWYEATQVRTYSGAFDSYLKTARDLDREDAERKKNDPISRYLDTLEKEFQDAAPVGSR
jgi:hypothetical protein